MVTQFLAQQHISDLVLSRAQDLTSPGTLVESIILMKEILVRMMNLASPAGCLLLWKMRGS